MSLRMGPKLNFPEPEKRWWEREKEDVKERFRFAAFHLLEMVLEAWLTLDVLDLNMVMLLDSRSGSGMT